MGGLFIPSIKTSSQAQKYEQALEFMDHHVNAMIEGNAQELLWFLEHEPVYTLGTGAQEGDALEGETIPTLQTSRGGRSTYHGPGQRVVYVMLNLKERCQDIRHFVWCLEEWIIESLKVFGVESFRRKGRVGIWVNHPSRGEAKVAAIGLRVRKWISFHGISINVDPNLDHYKGIVPCGIGEYGVTSLKDLGVDITMDALDDVLVDTFQRILIPCLSSK